LHQDVDSNHGLLVLSGKVFCPLSTSVTSQDAIVIHTGSYQSFI